MKRIFLCFLVFTIIQGCVSKPKLSASFDFSAVKPFWKVVSILEKDIEPTDIEWDSLLLTPGYIEFTRRELTMKNYLRLGILPSKNEKLNEWIRKDYLDIKFPLHFREVIKNKSQINHFIKNVKDSNLANESINLTMDYLPKNINIDSIPPVSFIFFGKDARGYNPILVDALYAYELFKHKQLKYLLGHEMHHYIRNKHLTFEYPHDGSPDFKIITTIDQIHSEGIADLIDKDISFDNPLFLERTKRYQKLLEQAPIHIQQLDSLLIAYSKNKDLKNELATAIKKSVPMSGHTVGYFMAKTIQNHKSKEYLIKDIGNPFSFIYRYQNIALKNKGDMPFFSTTSINLIKDLATKYKKNHQ